MSRTTLLLGLLLGLPLALPVSTVPASNYVRSGEIVLHNAFPVVLENFPERAQQDVDGYIATNDCKEMGKRFVLVRVGAPDALVAVADCAQQRHVAYRVRMGLIADVDRAVWQGPEVPQQAELWPVSLRRAYWERMDRLR